MFIEIRKKHREFKESIKMANKEVIMVILWIVMVLITLYSIYVAVDYSKKIKRLKKIMKAGLKMNTESKDMIMYSKTPMVLGNSEPEVLSNDYNFVRLIDLKFKDTLLEYVVTFVFNRAVDDTMVDVFIEDDFLVAQSKKNIYNTVFGFKSYAFSRIVGLPRNVLPRDMKINFRENVITVSIPKKEAP